MFSSILNSIVATYFLDTILVESEFVIILPFIVQYNVGGGFPLAEQLNLVVKVVGLW